MEGVFLAVLRALIELEAVPWLIVVLLLLAIVWLVRVFQKEIKTIEASRLAEAKECDAEKKELYNRLIDLGEASKSALISNTTSTANLSFSVEARAAAFVKNAELLQAILDRIDANRIYFADWAQRIERRTEAIERAAIDRFDRRRDP